MLKNFVKSTAPIFQDTLHADGSKTYDTVYGMIHIDRPYVVHMIEMFLSGQLTDKMGFYTLLKDGLINPEECSKIMRVID